MPYARKKTVVRRRAPARPKRTIKRKPRPTNRPSGPFRNINTSDPFPSKKSFKFHYAENHLLTTGALGVCGSEQVYRCNSLFDPDFAVGGHQPYGYDQTSNLYRKYKVNAISVQLTWTDPSVDGMVVAAMFQPPNGAFTLNGKVPSQIREQPMSVTRSINNSGKQSGSFKQYFPISSLSGLTNLQFKADVDLFTADVGANPAAFPLFRFAAADDRGVAGSTIVVKTKIIYYATLYERKIQGPS